MAPRNPLLVGTALRRAGRGGGGARPAAARTHAAGGGASVWKSGVRDRDYAGPQLFVASRTLGPSAGRGRERGAALRGAGSGLAHGPGLSEQRSEVGAVSSARSPRV